MKRDKMLGYVQTLVSVSPPAIQNRDGCEFDFEPELTSQPLQEIKRTKRHNRTREMLARDPFIILPA